MFADLRNDLLFMLSDSLNPEDLEVVSIALDSIATKYNITKAEQTELILYDDENQKLLRRFIATKSIEGKSQKTLERYSNEISKMIEFLNIPIKNITTDHIRYILGSKRSTCSARTVDGIRKIYSGFFKWLTEEELIDRNPCIAVKCVKYKKEKKKAFSSTEMERIKEACDNIRDLALVDFLYATGCRVSELVSIDINDVDFDNKSVEVLGKGNKVRTVYISSIALMHLKDYLESREDNSKALFAGRRTERISDNGIRRILKKLEEKSKVSNIHPHRFRRTLATNLLAGGMNLEQVAQILGHDDISTTQIYCNIKQESVKNDYMKICA